MQIDIVKILKELKIENSNLGCSTGLEFFGNGHAIVSESPVDGKVIGKVIAGDAADYKRIIEKANSAYSYWRKLPAPKRGEIVRQLGDKLRVKKDALGALVSYEMGKSLQEGLGEVQEMIDICDFAVGLSRQLYGLTMHSERPMHRMYEQWHPIGIVGVITAFNFPVAVWAWNAALALVCGDVCIWKPSHKTPLCSVACQHIWNEVAKENNLPEGINSIINGQGIGELICEDANVPLVSATGSTRMGKAVGSKVAERFGKSLLELGGNNAIILSEHADLNTAIPSIVFGAVGTAGQRCTTTRRLIVSEKIFDEVKQRLVKAYGQLRIGNPLDTNNHVGPLIDKNAVKDYLHAVDTAKQSGGKVLVESGVLTAAGYESACYVSPAVIEVAEQYEIVKHETFAPILYVMKYKTLDEAIALQNGVPQGLSSSIMTLNLREAELFLSAEGSDCGIANVNIGTSGAEIGGAFGGEKETGGGRESGSDAWKIYMRRQTNTINYGTQLPLAQGIKFDLN
jgi:aldehyde dehydrogenase (NAD+)